MKLLRRWFVPVSLAALAILAVLQARAGADLRPPQQPGLPAPAFALPDLQGKQVSLRALRGRPVLVNFFATWCAPCRAELPALKALAQRGCVQVVGIAENSGTAAELAGFARTRGVTYPVLLDDESAGKDYSVVTLPHSALIDAEGKLLGTFRGEVTRAGVESALQAAGAPNC